MLNSLDDRTLAVLGCSLCAAGLSMIGYAYWIVAKWWSNA